MGHPSSPLGFPLKMRCEILIYVLIVSESLECFELNEKALKHLSFQSLKKRIIRSYCPSAEEVAKRFVLQAIESCTLKPWAGTVWLWKLLLNTDSGAFHLKLSAWSIRYLCVLPQMRACQALWG